MDDAAVGRLGDPAACTCFNLRKATRAVTQIYDAALAPASLRATQFSVLVAAQKSAGITMGRLAEELVMDRTTLSRNLAPLERDGLLRVVAGDDRRSREVQITQIGRTRLKQTLPLWKAAQARMVARLGKDGVEALLGNLEAAIEATRE